MMGRGSSEARALRFTPAQPGVVLDKVRRLQIPRSYAASLQSRTFAPACGGRGLWGGAATILEREAEQSRLGATERAAAAAMNPE